jgi:hypothetical protein
MKEVASAQHDTTARRRVLLFPVLTILRAEVHQDSGIQEQIKIGASQADNLRGIRHRR